MPFQIGSADDASEALRYFNHFHDGFLESLILTVTPDAPAGFGFAQPVRYDGVLTFVHTNYPAAQEDSASPPRVQMRLTGVKSLNVGDLVPVDNMLQECLIQVDAEGTVHLDVGGDGLVTFACEGLTIEELESR